MTTPHPPESPAALCPRCGCALPAAAAARHCPRCLVELALRPTGTTAATAAAPAPDPAELQPLFPAYELQTLLGRGGMGVVYRARHKKLDRLVAVKLLRPDQGADPAFAERFEREARALAMLSHPGIVAIHDFGQTGGFFFLVMEFVDGANLRELLGQGRLTTRDVLAFVPQLCDALQYAHGRGVVHRDIKPENILVDQDGRVHVADFGLAKLLGRDPAQLGLTQTHQAVGTPHYMAPEQVGAAGTVDHRADLYSLGVVIYEMLTGTLPIGRFQPPSAKAGDARAFDPVVMKSLESDPAQRYQQAEQLKTDVEAAATGKAVAVSHAAPRPRWRTRPLRQHPHWPFWHHWVGCVCIVLTFANLIMLGPVVYGLFWLLGHVVKQDLPVGLEPRRNPEPQPWHWWLGFFVVLLASGGPWASLENRRVYVHAWNATFVGIPLWLTMVAAFFVPLLATWRAGGATIPRGSILVVSLLGTLLTLAFLIRTVNTPLTDLGPGGPVMLFTFLVWAHVEWRRAQPAKRERPRS